MKVKRIVAMLVFIGLVVATGIRADEESITVVVKDGDTLTGIAAQYMKNPGRWQEMAKYNNLAEPYLIRPGMKIKIPKSMLKNAPAPSPDADPPALTAPTHAANPSPSPMPTTPLTGRASKAGAIYVKGDVVRIPEKTAEEPLKVGAKLVSGDRLVTDATSFASLSLPVGAELVIGSDTRLQLEIIEENLPTQSGKVVVQLEQGRIRIKDPRRGMSMNIKAGAVSVSAGEGEFQFRFEDSGIKYLEVYKGKAVATSGESSVTVTAGNGVVIVQDAISQPKPLPPAPVMKAYSYDSAEGPKAGVMWEQSPKAASYRMEIAQDEQFLKTVYIAGYAGATLDFAYFQQFPPGRYAFRLIAVSPDGLWGPPSNAMVYNQ